MTFKIERVVPLKTERVRKKTTVGNYGPVGF